MKILVLNWRSVKDPLSGGAELVTFEHAKRWIKNYHAQVTWLCPRYKTGVSEEIVDGVHFVYIARPLTRNTLSLFFNFPYFYISAFFKYLSTFRGTIDVVIDQVHGLPYLTPLYVKEPIFVHVNEIAGEIWDKMYKFPINIFGKLLENFVFKPYVWRGCTFVAISESTKNDILKLGVNEKNIKLVHCGVNMPPLEYPATKEQNFTILYLNRLVKMKGIERALHVVSVLAKQIPNLQFWVVGRGEGTYVDYLKAMSKDLNISENTHFFGFISDEEKTDFLTKAHVLFNPSYKEGWGLVNIEANCRSTPAVGYKVPGIVDSISHGISGYIADDKNEDEIVKYLLKVYGDSSLQETSLAYAKKFSWHSVSEAYYQVLLQGTGK